MIPSIQDDLGITYLIENPQQFWAELEDVIEPPRETPTLQQLDSSLKRFLDLCATYHEQYLQSHLQLEHACEMLLNSELFAFHSERMSDILVSSCQMNTDPHYQYISYHVLLAFGRRRTEFFRLGTKWKPLIPFLIDHILVDLDSNVEDTYQGLVSAQGSSNGASAVPPVPIEAKLRSLGVKFLYEVCRVQKFSLQNLRIFDDSFIEYLFELVEETRHMHDDTFNYSVIKLIVALNEQFMVATLDTEGHASSNRVLRVLIGRLGSSKTFGENMIFMLNRAEKTPDDLCMQLLVLKILYLLFTTAGTSEYFYTNDLQVLVDVFLRELVDLDEDSESLRHTFLRVLHPLLTKTQLRDIPYKRPQIVYALESLLSNSKIRDVNPTTRRLVERCLGGDWCVQLRKNSKDNMKIQSADSTDSRSQLGITSVQASAQLKRSSSKTLKSSKSMEFKQSPMASGNLKASRSTMDSGQPNNTSSISLGTIPSSTTLLKSHLKTSTTLSADHHKHAPPTPSKRRKPPPIPVKVGQTNSGATIAAIKSSSPLKRP